MIFYLGADSPSWLWTKGDKIPLFVSDTRLRKYKKYKTSLCPWALDSGGFSEIHKHGKWTQDPDNYAKRVRRYKNEIGSLQFAAIQDWMCEDSALQMTGKTPRQHQYLTIKNYNYMVNNHGDLPWLPVLQGRLPRDYIKHLQQYRKLYPDLTYFGIGSVCRRAKSQEIVDIVFELYEKYGVVLHGFGVKTAAINKIGKILKSADSTAWSFGARYKTETFLPTCTHKRCNHCYPYAKHWYRQQIKRV